MHRIHWVTVSKETYIRGAADVNALNRASTQKEFLSSYKYPYLMLLVGDNEVN